MTEHIQVVTTTGRKEDAEAIGRRLVEERLAACVQIAGPITSIYRWEGKIETSQEWQCWAKTRQECYRRIEETVAQLHPYDVPEILAIPILSGSGSYLSWLDEEVKGP